MSRGCRGQPDDLDDGALGGGGGFYVDSTSSPDKD